MGDANPIDQTADGTVGKALHVLDMVVEKSRPVRFNDVLADSPYPKATLYRLLQTLTNQGLLNYDEDQQSYAPGIRLVRLAHAAWRQSSLAPIARPFLDALSAKIDETIHLAQLERGQVLYVDKRNAASPIEMFSQAGKIGPGYCTGVGKAMMAFLDHEAQETAIKYQSFFKHTQATLTSADELRAELIEIKEAGYAFDREEHELGIICIAVPILTMKQRVVGALSVTTSKTRRSLGELRELGPELSCCAKDIAQAAESWRFPS